MSEEMVPHEQHMESPDGLQGREEIRRLMPEPATIDLSFLFSQKQI
jgi:hypothetical protein